MAEERTLGLARARETSTETGDEEPSKEELQRRMEEARDSITNTVTEIKENVAQQVESVKDALDWREHFKRQPLAWSLGAAGVGFFVGYGIAAAFTETTRDEIRYSASPAYSLSAQPVTHVKRLNPTAKSEVRDCWNDSGNFCLRATQPGSGSNRRPAGGRTLNHRAAGCPAGIAEENQDLDRSRPLQQDHPSMGNQQEDRTSPENLRLAAQT